MLASNIIPIFIVACVVALILAASRRKKEPTPTAADPRVHVTTLPARQLPDGRAVQVLHHASGARIRYLMRHALGTSEGLSRRAQRDTLRVSGEIDFGAYYGAGSHIALMLRNRADLRNADSPDPENASGISIGHGVIFGRVGGGMPSYPPNAPAAWAAAAEQFDKQPGQRVVLPETQSPPIPRRVWFSIISTRDADRMTLRYTLAGVDGYSFDSGEIETEHRLPVDGDDVSLAMFPLAPGTVHFGPIECAWSESPLEPAAPPLTWA